MTDKPWSLREFRTASEFFVVHYLTLMATVKVLEKKHEAENHANVAVCVAVVYIGTSLVPRPLPDFISQPWRKIGRRPGSKTTSRTGSGELGQYVMWTRFVLTDP